MVVTLLIVAGVHSAFLLFLFRKVRHMAATEQDLQNDLDAIGTAVGVLADEIKALKDAGVSLVTQEQLDALDAKAKAIVAAATGAA